MKTFISLSLLLCLAFSTVAQTNYFKPKKLKAKSTYTHIETKTEFPVIIDKYKRTSVYSFNKEEINIGATYEIKNNYDKTTFTVYVYPADDKSEGRLRSEYLSSLQSIANASYRGVGASQHPVRYMDDEYKINGYTADIASKFGRSSSRLTVYECGSWFLKIRLSSESLDSIAFENLEKKIVDVFSPAKLVKQNPLSGKFKIHLAKGAFRDSTMLHTVLGSSYKKFEWMSENIDSVELMASIPDLYLEYNSIPLKEMVKLWQESPFKSSTATDKYLAELKMVIDSGFLNEMIVDQYHAVVILPEGLELDLKAYRSWLLQNPISIDINEKFYVLSSSEE
ncbi:hypothetical protein [Pontibacter mangrovi]|uniref:Uncharacterized protein n=1 Tax=Pontibacter mangrovi TaxID=2589816 RepID=A0A501W521_9BACT|nr:hypothetical protein [Pontibacter mangrovi]TPE44348.1 hypothetical protein FJM65_09360 [Pontibacter mangrovi]